MDSQPLKSIAATGSPVVELTMGHSYALIDRPGVYTLVQFETSESAVVRELGSGALLTVATQSVRPLVHSKNTRSRDLVVTGAERIVSAEAKLVAIKPLLVHGRIPRAALVERAEEVGHAPKTLRKWISRYRRDPRLSSLSRKRRSDVNLSRFDTDVDAAIEDALVALAKNGGMRIDDAHKDLVDAVEALAKAKGLENWRTPSYGTLYSRWMKVSEQQKTEAILGKRPARRLHGLQRGSLEGVNHPLSLVQVDHLELPIHVVDEVHRLPIGKGWITVLIDVFSRCVHGYYVTLESPGDLSLGQAMCHAILPKAKWLETLPYKATWPIHGFMWTIHADNAGEFHANMLELAAKEYCIEIIFRKVREPQYGAYIESFLGTVSEKLRRAPGATREGPASLGETDPSATAAMTLGELEGYLLSLFVEYHNTPHTGLGKVTPLSRFAEGMRGGPGILPIGSLRQATDPEKLRLDFLPCDERNVHTKGIVWDYIWYSHDCLQRWVNAVDPQNKHEKRKFLVRRDPRDLGRIYFWDPGDDAYFEIGTRNLTRESISLWELRAIKKFLEARGKSEIDEDAIFEARAERKRIEQNSVAKTEAAQRQRARRDERERRAKRGVEKPSSEEKAVPPPNVPKASVPVTGIPFEMDWGD